MLYNFINKTGEYSLRLFNAQKILTLICSFLLLSISVQATTVSLISVVNNGNGTYTFNYELSVPSNERLDVAATNGVTCPGPGSTIVQCNPPGTFFTIYDIPGLLNVSAQPVNFTNSIQALGITPSSVNSSTIDLASQFNVTFTYNGPTAQGPNTYFPFSVVSNCGLVNNAGSFTSQTTKSNLLAPNDPSNGLTLQTVGSVPIPACATAAPVTVTGRVAAANGRGIARAQIVMTGSDGNRRVATTNPFGYFSFADVEEGTYIFEVKSKGHRFAEASKTVNITGDFDGLNFTAE